VGRGRSNLSVSPGFRHLNPLLYGARQFGPANRSAIHLTFDR